MLVFTHAPTAKSKAKRHIALVGKGVTYDTGGLSLKVGGSMVGMKADMGGAAAVLGAFAALVKGGAPRKVSAVICLAENAIGPAASSPTTSSRCTAATASRSTTPTRRGACSSVTA